MTEEVVDHERSLHVVYMHDVQGASSEKTVYEQVVLLIRVEVHEGVSILVPCVSYSSNTTTE
jgi:hypothetical protein